MHKISEFSRITKMTVKALRYYDDEMILTPSYRDESNSYRYYNENDYHKAQLVSLLRDFGFSIAEMKEVLSCCNDETDLSYYLVEKKEQINKNMEREYELIEKINFHIKPQETKKCPVAYQIEVKDFPPVFVASIRFKGNYNEIGNHIKTILNAVKNNMREDYFSLSYDDEYKEEADIEVCVPIREKIVDNTISIKTLPAIKAICTIHNGNYNSSNFAYKALLDYANEKKLNLGTPSREIYRIGPGMIFKGNENNYVTEIVIPIKEDEHA